MFLKTSQLITIGIAFIISLHGCSLTENAIDRQLQEANEYEFAGKLSKAEEIYKSMPVLQETKASPMQLVALTNMGKFYLRIKNYKETISICKKAIRVDTLIYGDYDGLKSPLLFMLGLAHEGLKEYEQATIIYRNLLSNKGLSSVANDMKFLLPLIRLGDIEFKQKKYLSALKYYLKAYSISPLPIEIYRNLSYRIAFCSANLKYYHLAEKHFKNSLPSRASQVGPSDLFTRYIALLKQCEKYGTASLACEDKIKWDLRNKEYRNWLFPRVSNNSRFNLVDKYAMEDYFDFTGSANQESK